MHILKILLIACIKTSDMLILVHQGVQGWWLKPFSPSDERVRRCFTFKFNSKVARNAHWVNLFMQRLIHFISIRAGSDVIVLWFFLSMYIVFSNQMIRMPNNIYIFLIFNLGICSAHPPFTNSWRGCFLF